jgi:hypothetical protein
MKGIGPVMKRMTADLRGRPTAKPSTVVRELLGESPMPADEGLARESSVRLFDRSQISWRAPGW